MSGDNTAATDSGRVQRFGGRGEHVPVVPGTERTYGHTYHLHTTGGQIVQQRQRTKYRIPQPTEATGQTAPTGTAIDHPAGEHGHVDPEFEPNTVRIFEEGSQPSLIDVISGQENREGERTDRRTIDVGRAHPL